MCETIESWGEMFYCINPYSWAYLGVAMAITLSILGAVWGIYITGASLIGCAIKSPRIRTKNLVSVVFCEAVAIYGVIMAIILQGKVGDSCSTNSDVYYGAFSFAGYSLFWTGISVGFSNLFCG